MYVWELSTWWDYKTKARRNARTCRISDKNSIAVLGWQLYVRGKYTLKRIMNS